MLLIRVAPGAIVDYWHGECISLMLFSQNQARILAIQAPFQEAIYSNLQQGGLHL